MDERTFWVRIWQTITIGAVILGLGMSGCTMHRHMKLTEIIMNGHDPIRAGIALDGQSTSTEAITALLSDNK